MDENIFGKDLRLRETSLFALDLQRTSGAPAGSDINVTTGHESVGQALLLSLRTPQGALRHLGHPDYGSRLFELFGKLNTAGNRRLAELYAEQTVRRDPRVAEVREIRSELVEDDPTRINLHVSFMPIDSPVPINLVVPVLFGG